MIDEQSGGFLADVRVIELADELGEYCGKVLAGLGADVIKVEPPGGEKTRGYGPFLQDIQDCDRSLHFWHYNFGKRSRVVDLDTEAGRQQFVELVADADVLVESRPLSYLRDRGLSDDHLQEINPRLVTARLSPFGETGPWAGYLGSDVVHLALGGMAMNCGYDPEPDGLYDTPPIAPQMWQAYQIAGEMTVIAVLAAVFHAHDTGCGQVLHTPVHQAVAQQTETDLPNWLYSMLTHRRLTCRHSRPSSTDAPALAATKDGRWVLPYRTYLSAGGGDAEFASVVRMLDEFSMAEDLTEPRYSDLGYRSSMIVNQHIGDVVSRFVGRFLSTREIWRDFQAIGSTAAPLRRPEENVNDEHWRARQTFFEVHHPDLDQTFTEIGAKWVCEQVPWRSGPAAPLLGEHDGQAFGPRPSTTSPPPTTGRKSPFRSSQRGRPFALSDVRLLDLSWLLASAGAGRFLSGLGAEVIKVEHKSRWDTMRLGPNGVPPDGGRHERDTMTVPPPAPRRPDTPNGSGFFMEINAGKRAISLNLKHDRGKEILRMLIERSNALAEGFSPGTMDRMGFGYSQLREINPGIVYVQQSGMGQTGTYGRMRSYGPVAQAFSGLSEMSGLPEPFPPAGIGYSYLDWCGAYNMAIALLAGLYRQRTTGQGCWIDASQVEAGIFMTGTAVLDHSVNRRTWRRCGNRSPYKTAAPHGIYRALGEDRWIAIAAFTDEQWRAVTQVLGSAALADDPRFATLDARLEHVDVLDALVEQHTTKREPYELMERLQAARVPAGVCQTAQDRCEHDPQLQHLQWLIELDQSLIGRWPVRELQVELSATPSYMGGAIDRHGPNYAEDNEYVYGDLLGFTSRQIRELIDDDVI